MADPRELLGAPLPLDEVQRLALLAQCRILDTPAESDFDDLTRLAAQICGTPIALISLVDGARQWFKSRVGVDVTETPRRLAFCGHAILDRGHLLIVPDATKDARFAANELVTGPLGIRFYAGAPLVMEEGLALGTLCVIDQRPRELTPAQQEALAALARQVVSQIQLRRQNFALQKVRAEREQFFSLPLDMLCVAGADGSFKLLNPAFGQALGYSNEELLGSSFLDFLHPDDAAATRAELKRLNQGARSLNLENRYRCKDGTYRWLSWKAAPTPDGVFYASARDITEGKEAEEKLRALSELQRGILESAAHAIIATTPEGVITAFNPAAQRMLGYSAEELVGRLTPAVFHDPEEVAARAREFGAALGQPVAPGFEVFVAKTRRYLPNEHQWTYIRSDGSRFPVQLSVTALRDAAGGIVGFLGIAIDITERQRAEKLLAAHQALLRQFVRYTPAAVAMLDREMRYVQVSERWLKDYQLDGQDLIGRAHYDVFPDIPERWKAVHRRVLAGAVERCEEDSFPRADGRLDWLQWEARPWFQVDEEIGGLIFFTQVITERKRAEARLIASEKRFREAIEYSAIGMALVGLDGTWLKVNHALCALVGRSEAELRRCTFQDLTHPEDLHADLANVEALLAGTIDHYQMEKRYFHRDGHVVRVLLAVTLVRDAEGQPVHFVSQIEDITERFEAEQRLKASLVEKETLLKEVHHRVKNNLQVITSLLQLQSREITDPALLALFRESQDRVRAMALIHEELYRSGNLAAVDFGAHLRDLAATLLRAYSTSAAPVRMDAETEPMHLNIDLAVPLSLIVNELVTNAFKHAFAGGRGGTLHLVFRAIEEDRLLLSVGDDGPGLGADFAWEKTTSLGLKVVRILTRQIGGRIEVQRHPSAKFTVTFPRTRTT